MSKFRYYNSSQVYHFVISLISLNKMLLAFCLKIAQKNRTAWLDILLAKHIYKKKITNLKFLINNIALINLFSAIFNKTELHLMKKLC